MLNTTELTGYDIDIIIEDRISELLEALHKEQVDVDYSDINYSFLSREEYIYINSDILYYKEDVPSKFGVYRGYAEGGIHSELRTTEIDRLPARRIPKAERLLKLFEQCFRGILRDVEEASREAEPERAGWDSIEL